MFFLGKFFSKRKAAKAAALFYHAQTQLKETESERRLQAVKDLSSLCDQSGWEGLYAGQVIEILAEYLRSDPTLPWTDYPERKETLHLIKRLYAKDLVQERQFTLDLTGVTVNGYDFSALTLPGLKLNKGDGREAVFNHCDLSDGEFQAANLQEADFSEAMLERAWFNDAQLKGAIFATTNLQGARFNNANLFGADFNAADLQGARFNGAILHKCQFDGADLRYANFTGATGLTHAGVKRAVIDETTKLPSDFV